MARTKRGKHVWQCTACGYWSQRKWNVERHNVTTHNAEASLQPAYAALITEPSWQVTPVTLKAAAPDTILPFDTQSPQRPRQPPPSSSPPFRQGGNTEFEMRTTRLKQQLEEKEQEARERRQRSLQPEQDPIKMINSSLEDLLRLNENMDKLKQLTGVHNMAANAAATTTPGAAIPNNISPASGYLGRMCEKCPAVFALSIPDDKDPVESLLAMAASESAAPSSSSSSSPPSSSIQSHDNNYHHQLYHKGPAFPEFKSQQPTQEQRVKQEIELAHCLFGLEKYQLQNRNILLVAKNLDGRQLPPSLQTFNLDSSEADSHPARKAIKAAIRAIGRDISDVTEGSNSTSNTDNSGGNIGAIRINDAELWQFLHYVHATAGVVEIADDQRSRASPQYHYYGVTVYGQPSELDILNAAINKGLEDSKSSIMQEGQSRRSQQQPHPTPAS